MRTRRFANDYCKRSYCYKVFWLFCCWATSWKPTLSAHRRSEAQHLIVVRWGQASCLQSVGNYHRWQQCYSEYPGIAAKSVIHCCLALAGARQRSNLREKHRTNIAKLWYPDNIRVWPLKHANQAIRSPVGGHGEYHLVNVRPSNVVPDGRESEFNYRKLRVQTSRAAKMPPDFPGQDALHKMYLYLTRDNHTVHRAAQQFFLKSLSGKYKFLCFLKTKNSAQIWLCW